MRIYKNRFWLPITIMCCVLLSPTALCQSSENWTGLYEAPNMVSSQPISKIEISKKQDGLAICMVADLHGKLVSRTADETRLYEDRTAQRSRSADRIIAVWNIPNGKMTVVAAQSDSGGVLMVQRFMSEGTKTKGTVDSSILYKRK